MDKVKKILTGYKFTELYFSESGISKTVIICSINAVFLLVPFIIELLIGQDKLVRHQIATSPLQLLSYLIILGAAFKMMPEMGIWATVLFVVNTALNYLAAKYNLMRVVIPEGYEPPIPNEDGTIAADGLERYYSPSHDYSVVFVLILIG